MDSFPQDLTGKLLVAMPGMGDPRFDHSVVFLCAYSDEGAMGLIINKEVPDVSLNDLLDQLDIDRGRASDGIRVHFGGPVEGGRGFVLHSSEYESSQGTLEVDETFGMTATKDILEDIARGTGPARSLTMLGYAGWGPGQLEGELQQNAWLTVDADMAIVFEPDLGTKWSRALGKLGIDPLVLSSEGGRA
ncbi:YqgE/AlgH family protein [Maritimibacter sp. DP1N21-5]|uniref:YqgE/AlgH family protein n=1 Tax=Maritimibacter sp. DP1N21-5 TaxID=2836867 RepID=UPI001C493596|nr:YqgE/AlgH family protein [Maritimibacter sp. DP1N21-5]MBV7407634.1 YqgE/AlgH family protein [Maritimibacter sp. DP1N21-5]